MPQTTKHGFFPVVLPVYTGVLLIIVRRGDNCSVPSKNISQQLNRLYATTYHNDTSICVTQTAQQS